MMALSSVSVSKSASQPESNAAAAAAAGPVAALEPAATPAILLALDAGTRNTGWAVFQDYVPLRTGVITLRRRQHSDDAAAARIVRLAAALDELAAECAPAAAAVSQPAGLGGLTPAPALALLETALEQWGRRAGIPLAAYPAAAVRRAVAGHPRAAAPALAFAVMSALNLLGARKTAYEWGALAVGAYHLYRTAPLAPG